MMCRCGRVALHKGMNLPRVWGTPIDLDDLFKWKQVEPEWLGLELVIKG